MLRTQEFLSMGICRGMTQVQSQFPPINLNWFYDFFFFISMSGVNWHGIWEAGTRGTYKQRSFRSEMALWGDCRALVLMVLACSGNKLTAAFSYGLKQPILKHTGEAIVVKQCVTLGQIPLLVRAQAMQLCCPAQNRTWLINHSLQLTRQTVVTVT